MALKIQQLIAATPSQQPDIPKSAVRETASATSDAIAASSNPTPLGAASNVREDMLLPPHKHPLASEEVLMFTMETTIQHLYTEIHLSQRRW